MKYPAAVLLLTAATALCAHAQTSKPLDLNEHQGTGKHQWITFLGPEQQSIPAEKLAEVPLHFHIEDGFHINSHKPRAEYLIPTQLVIVEEPGMAAQQVDFPPGTDYAFSFDPSNKLDVYSGDFTLVAHVKASAGERTLGAVLRYQACDRAACYPPKTLPLEVKIIAR